MAPQVPFLDDSTDLTYTNSASVYGRYDLTGTESARIHNKQVNREYYQQVQDSISTRINNGFYEKYPEQYERDIKMRDQYAKHPTCPGGWTCIMSVDGLEGGKTQSNYRYVTNNVYKNRNRTKVALDDSNIENHFNNLKPGTIHQTGDYGHSKMFLGLENNGMGLWYDNHGSPSPYINGN